MSSRSIMISQRILKVCYYYFMKVSGATLIEITTTVNHRQIQGDIIIITQVQFGFRLYLII